MKILDRYLIRQYLLGCLPVLLALAALFSFLTLSEELEDVGKGFYTTRDALLVTLLSTPSLVLELLPVTLLLGSLFGLGGLARYHEITVMRSSGVSLSQLASPVLGVAVAMVVIVVAMRFYVIPDLELRAMQIRAKTEATEILRDQEGGGYWVRTGKQLLHISKLMDGRVLTGIEIYILDSGKVARMIRAERGEIKPNRKWQLSRVESYDFQQPRLVKTLDDQLLWPSRLSTRQTESLVVPVEAMSSLALYRYIRLLDRNKLDSHSYRVLFWQQVSQLPALLIMALLSLPFLLGLQRSGGLGRSAVIGGAIGIGFYLAEQLMSHLSTLLSISPVIAALLPETLMALLTWRLLKAAYHH